MDIHEGMVFYYGVDCIVLSFRIMSFIVELWNYYRVTDEA